MTLERYRDIVVVNSDHHALKLSLAFKKLPPSTQRDYFGGTREVGWFYLYADEQLAPGMVMECVMSHAGDSVTSLYKPHPAFESISELIRARGRLMAALSEKVGLSAENIGIRDDARGRDLGLDELSTGQLIDLLAERLGHTVLKSDSHGQELPAGLSA